VKENSELLTLPSESKDLRKLILNIFVLVKPWYRELYCNSLTSDYFIDALIKWFKCLQCSCALVVWRCVPPACWQTCLVVEETPHRVLLSYPRHLRRTHKLILFKDFFLCVPWRCFGVSVECVLMTHTGTHEARPFVVGSTLNFIRTKWGYPRWEHRHMTVHDITSLLNSNKTTNCCT
jgi:hypothetical protein